MLARGLALAIGLCLFGPLGWQHYYLLPMLLLPGLAAIAPARVVAVAVFPAFLGENIFFFTGLLGAPFPPTVYLCVAVGGWIATLVLIDRLVRRATTAPG